MTINQVLAFCLVAVLVGFLVILAMMAVQAIDLLKKTGFAAAELLWSSYMQSGFYAIKK